MASYFCPSNRNMSVPVVMTLLSFDRSFKTPFMASLIYIQITWILLFTRKFRKPRCGHPWNKV